MYNCESFDNEAYWQYLMELCESISQDDMQYADTEVLEVTDKDGECSRSHP